MSKEQFQQWVKFFAQQGEPYYSFSGIKIFDPKLHALIDKVNKANEAVTVYCQKKVES